MPAMPPPMTSACLVIDTSLEVSVLKVAARAIDMRTRSRALRVAAAWSPACTHESWLRMLAISNR